MMHTKDETFDFTDELNWYGSDISTRLIFRKSLKNGILIWARILF